MAAFFRLVPFALAALLVGCGGGGAGKAVDEPALRFAGDYTGSYALASNGRGATEGSIVLDVDPDGKAEGSVTVGGTVYDFKGRLDRDGALRARGVGIAVAASLARDGATRALVGTLTLSGEIEVERAPASLTLVAAP